MYNNNLSITIVRIAFAKGSDQIHVGLTKNGNKTFVGEIVYSEELTISHYNKLLNVDGNNLVGCVGTICIADDDEANALISQIESIQAARPVNSRGNKYPFVFLRVITDGNEGDIIFNKGVGGAPHRLTFLNVECIEVVQVETPQVVAPSRSSYGTVRYRPQVKANTSASVKTARAGLEVSSNDVTPHVDARILRSEGMKRRVAPSFNRNIVESVGEVEEQSLESLDSLDSQQDKLNAIAVAMKAAGMSGAEIAQALKAELELVV
ncbi:MAG: hypothetical protein AAGE84_23390 [Cyanobacteria bacterium P01_G01_bin.39]